MRFSIAYYLMLIYVTVMFKPFIPMIKDALSHTFAEAIHIATVHAIYGSNHLQKELSDNNAEDIGNKHQSTNSEVQVHVSTFVCACIFYSLPSDKNYSSKFYQLKIGFIIKYSPPPKLS